MYELGCFLKEWQTLIGAFIGGIFSLLVALIVAYKVRSHDEIAAAYILLIDLRSFVVQAETLEKASKEQGSSLEESSLMATAGLLSSPPTLSPLFEESVMRVSPVDKYLTAHLALFKKIFSEIEFLLKRFAGQPLDKTTTLWSDFKKFQLISMHLPILKIDQNSL